MVTNLDGFLVRGRGLPCSWGAIVRLICLGALLAIPGMARAGGSCLTNADCNQSTNFCRPGVCDLFGQCQYNHSDAMCRVPPHGDNLFCNGVDFCNATTQQCDTNPVNCLPPTPQCSETLDACVQCTSSSHCSAPTGVCNTSNGTCVQCTTNTHCNDGLVCNGQETCNGGVCQAGTPVTCTTKRCIGGSNVGGICTSNANCPGGGTCVSETCSEVYQGCAQCESDVTCNDGLYCNGQETCNKSGRCVAGTAVACKRCNGGTFGVCQTNADCPAGVTCTATGFCDETFDRCVQCLLTSHCPSDLVFCTTAACVNNSCIQLSNPDARCGDGLYCNGNEICLDNSPGSVCTNCMLANPGNENACKNKVCNSMMTSPPYKSCTTNANCPAGVACVDACCGAGTPVNCEDNVVCTLNKCDEATDSCSTVIPTKTCNNAARTPCETNADCPSGFTCTGTRAYCDDGLHCNGLEFCNGFGCVNETPRVCYNVPFEISCQSDADCFFCASGINEGDPCSVPADCPGSSCVGTPCQVNCRGLNSQCTRGDCNETTDQCVATPIRQNQACDDGDACTINEICSTGNCIPNPSIPPSDSYRCVRLEWRNISNTTPFVGDAITAELWAVADGCAGNNGACPVGQADIVGLRALINWNHIQLSLDPPASTNPLDPCDSPDACFVCPAQQYNWQESRFLNDCPTQTTGGDGINGPCPFTGFPGNDGTALYTAFDQLLPCPPSNTSIPACVPTNGLLVTRFRFRALSGGQSNLSFLPCAGATTKTSVTSAVSPPSGLTSPDILKAVVPSAAITVRCTSSAQCNDQNPCTTDSCNLSTNLCSFVNTPGATCNDGQFCTLTDTCSATTCVGGSSAGVACTSNAQCPGGTCPTSVCNGTGVRCTGSGTCQGGSNPGTSCTSSAQCTNGWCSANTFCDEVNDRCAQCGPGTNACVGGANNNLPCTTGSQCPGGQCLAPCRDNNICTQDVCAATGACTNPPVNCSDGLSCTTDTCAITSVNPPVFECRHEANHAACATGLFCSGQLCDPQSNPNQTTTGCTFDHSCVSANGNPCAVPGTCNEANDTCGGCRTVTAAASGARYLRITPNVAQGSTPIAIQVKGDCEDNVVYCVSKYLSPRCIGGPNDGLACFGDADCPKTCLAGPNNGLTCTTDANCPGGSCRGTCDKGAVGESPHYMSASLWGTVHAHTGDIRPNRDYFVSAVCDFGGTPTVSAPVRVRTPRWGDCNFDNNVDFADISALVNAFRGLYNQIETYQSTNILGSGATVCGDTQASCFGQECINFTDVAAGVDAFRGTQFPCPVICP